MQNKSASVLIRARTWAFSAVLLLIVSMVLGSYAGAAPRELSSNDARETSAGPPANLSVNPPGPAQGPVDADYLSNSEYRLALLVSAICIATLLMLFLLLKGVPKLKAEDSLRTFGVVLIILGTLFFVAAGFSAQQIAPAIGLFGTIAGYLLGRIERRSEEQKNA
jgi:hypothetical protein